MIAGEREIEYSSDEDDERNDSTFADVEPTFKELVRTTKNQLYACIVRGPSITSKKAQDNTLLIYYIRKLNDVYQLCKVLHTNTSSSAIIQKKLSTFPLQAQDSIQKLISWLIDFYHKNQYVDSIPYNDYLEVQLKRYPFLQK